MVDISRRTTIEDVPVDANGLRLEEDYGGKRIDMRLARCEKCDAAIDPLLIQSPHVAVRIRENASRILTDQ